MAVLSEPAALYRPTERLHIALTFPDPSKFPGTPFSPKTAFCTPPCPMPCPVPRAPCPCPVPRAPSCLPAVPPHPKPLPPRRLTRGMRAQQRSMPARWPGGCRRPDAGWWCYKACRRSS